MSRFTIIWIAALLLLISCSSNNSEQRAIVEEWLGKEIAIPDDLKFQIQDTPINYDFNNADFKIVTYIDSTGCTNCKMRLKDWDEFIGQLKVKNELDLNFLMVVKNSNTSKVYKILKNDKFSHPIAIDLHNIFSKNNSIFNKIEYN